MFPNDPRPNQTSKLANAVAILAPSRSDFNEELWESEPKLREEGNLRFLKL